MTETVVPSTTHRSRWITAGILASLLVAAGLVGLTVPSEGEIGSPFDVTTPIGEPGVGRDIAATVHSVQRPTRVEDGGWVGEGPSVWVVADVAAEAVLSDKATSLDYAAIVIDEVTYSASERPSNTLLDWPLSTGISTRGWLVFELPERILESTGAASARLELASSALNDIRFDSRLVTVIDLTALPTRDVVTISGPEWGRR